MVHIFLRLPVFRRLRTATVVLALTLALAGCASVPPPDDSMNLAQTQLQAARDAGAADYAPVDLGFAQDKFQLAQTAMAERKYADAADLAEESRADAELASAKARLGAARAKIDHSIHENNRLRAEGEQAAQARQPPAATPAPAESTTLPDEEMPAPAASVLSTPPAGAGFQTVPDNSSPADSGQPASAATQGGPP